MIQPGLERISRLLARTPLPWRAIHVAGTNGKGSVCAYISRMLDVYNESEWRRIQAEEVGPDSIRNRRREQNRPLLHGRFTSPHLIDRWDCITINQQPISSQIFHAVEKRVKERNVKECIGASEFELLTATAFEIFTDENIDIAVVEVGMGGLKDATNVLGNERSVLLPDATLLDDFRPQPLVSVITRIGLDHQAFLGDTIEDIAGQKAGILKPGVPVIVYGDPDPDSENRGHQPEGVLSVVESAAAEKGLSVVNLGNDGKWPFLATCIDHLQDVINAGHSVCLRENSIVAFIATWTALERMGRVFSAVIDGASAHDDGEEQFNDSARDELAHGMIDVISTTVVPGRQQMLSIEKLTGRKELIMLDGAHNKDSSEALAEATLKLRTSYYRQPGTSFEPPVTWVLALSDSKAPLDVFGELLKKGDAVIAVEFGPVDGMPWVKSMSSAKILDFLELESDISCVTPIADCGRDLPHALRMATKRADGGPLVIAGSLYLVQDVLRLLRTMDQEIDASNSVEEPIG